MLAATVLVAAAGAALFDPSPTHPWNVVHHALFDREVEVGVPPCAVDEKGCLGRAPSELSRPAVGKRLLIGGDEPQIFIGEDVWFLEERTRNAEALRALAGALTVEPKANPVAALLLQNDCWERFDAIIDALAERRAKDRAALERLLPPLARLMRHLALPRATLAALPSNEPQLVRALPSLLAGFETRTGWAELRTDATRTSHDPVWRRETRHAERWGQRSFFRVFLRPATGLDQLAATLAPKMALPPDSVLLLVGSPIAIAKEGDLVPLPIVTIAELRVAEPSGFVPSTIAAMRHEILDGRRARLIANGGFERLSGDVLVPMGASCMPNRAAFTPLKAACAMCHASDGARITGPVTHGASRVSFERDARAAAQDAIDKKRASMAYQRLRGLW